MPPTFQKRRHKSFDLLIKPNYGFTTLFLLPKHYIQQSSALDVVFSTDKDNGKLDYEKRWDVHRHQNEDHRLVKNYRDWKIGKSTIT